MKLYDNIITKIPVQYTNYLESIKLSTYSIFIIFETDNSINNLSLFGLKYGFNNINKWNGIFLGYLAF